METMKAVHIHIRGIVQGVGFRPFIYGLADRYQLKGWVLNSSAGVEIEVEGEENQIKSFQAAVIDEIPPLAKIDSVEMHEIAVKHFNQFAIQQSQSKPGDFIPVSPDVSICDECLSEMLDPTNRRYRYPFINCTNCGPRFTIIQDIPYDRPKTSMAGFPLCDECRKEYENPLDRRFHAQPVACEHCGPHVWYEESGSAPGEKEDALKQAREAIKSGKIIAVKGLGGFHIACDASNSEALQKLRERKRRSEKPFALMAFDIDVIRKYCWINATEEVLLLSHNRPIVLLAKKSDGLLPEEIAPKQKNLGFMLPYTPLHYLLLEPEDGFPEVLVMTSGNLSEEPIAYQDEDAYDRLSPLVDGFLMHNRPIFMRVDDSVTRVVNDRDYPIRRSRGYVPDPILLPTSKPSICAAGGELKNAFCLSRNRYAFLSHHIGDVANYETMQSFENGIRHFQQLFKIQPEAYAVDLHPNYFTSQYIRQEANDLAKPLIEIQHHHAHLAACLADNQRYLTEEKVIGNIFDGTGYGTDGTIWGGEFLIGNFSGFERAYYLEPTPQPGGDLATRTPARMALAHLWQQKLEWDESYPAVHALSPLERKALRNQLTKKVNSPLTSSMGRLFDAVSAMIGVCENVNYEAQAAIELEAIADENEKGVYPFVIEEDSPVIGLELFWKALIRDLNSTQSPSSIAAKFHNSLVQLQLEICNQLRLKYNINTVVLSGGVWANQYLLTETIERLEANGFEVLFHQRVPCNDGGISLGQLMIAAEQLNLNQNERN
ncbi:MAG: carbamoyltransferase HypF [Anaerolineae bacterium]|jgi:hydrogenase maturation protein HypF|nr:carbamoyltransferase HypF [Anaerolineae bacterium]